MLSASAGAGAGAAGLALVGCGHDDDDDDAVSQAPAADAADQATGHAAVNPDGPTFPEGRLLRVQANMAAIGINRTAAFRDSAEHYATTFRGTGNDGGWGITSSEQGPEADEILVNMYRGDRPRSPIITAELMLDDTRLTELIDSQLAAPTVEERIQVIADLPVHLAEQSSMLPIAYAARTRDAVARTRPEGRGAPGLPHGHCDRGARRVQRLTASTAARAAGNQQANHPCKTTIAGASRDTPAIALTRLGMPVVSTVDHKNDR